jgi:hypothetical protein
VNGCSSIDADQLVAFVSKCFSVLVINIQRYIKKVQKEKEKLYDLSL